MAHSILYQRIMNSREWRSVRNQKLFQNPFCEECAKHGVIREAQCVHHLKEIESCRTEAEAWSVGLAIGGLQSLCFACHRNAHAGYHKKAAHKQRQEERLAAWISQQSGEDPLEKILEENKKAPV